MSHHVGEISGPRPIGFINDMCETVSYLYK